MREKFMRRPIKVAFLGSRPLSFKTFDVVVKLMEKRGESWIELSVFCKSDNKPPKGVVRWWKLGSLEKKAKKAGVAVISERELLSIDFDLVVMVFYNDILSKEFIERVPKGVTNLHFGYLPTRGYNFDLGSPHKKGEPFSKRTYRGCNVLTQAILNGESWQAVSFHFVTCKIDLGPVIEYAWNPIGKKTTAWDLQVASERKALGIFKKYFVRLTENSRSIECLSSGKDDYIYYSRNSLDEIRKLDPRVSDRRLDVVARAFSYPNTEPPYFLEGGGKKRYVVYNKQSGIRIMKPMSCRFIQKMGDII